MLALSGGRWDPPDQSLNAQVSSLNGSMNMLSQTESANYNPQSLTHHGLCFD